MKRNCCSNVGSNKGLLKFPLSFWSLYDNEWCAATFRNPNATFNPDLAVSTPSRVQIRFWREGVDGYKCPHALCGGGAKTIIALSWCVCVFVFTWQEGPANTISSSEKDSRHSGFWNLEVLSYYFFPNTLKHTGNFGHGLHTRLPFFMINRITLFSSSSEKHWYVCSLCPALSSKINISLVIPA